MSDNRAFLPLGRVALAADAARDLAQRATTKPLAWAESILLPKLIDDLVPYLISSVVPRIIDGALPHIREKVLPILIDDLTQSAQLRELISEQSRDVVADAATGLRGSTADADDRLEDGFRRMVRLAPAR